jgi:CelD/BcsL family acetyltransferase involved in cellulose biosynthesis/GT2 family glycosyltransferase
MATLFWVSCAVVGYVWVGYPLLLAARARLAPRPVRKGSFEPTVSVVLATREAGEPLAAKLADCAASDYPPGKLEIVVSLDGGSEADERSAGRALDGRRGRVVRSDRAEGKAAALDRGVAAASGEVLVFCDLRQRVEPGALRALVENLADPEVGAVSGELVLDGEADGGAGGLGLYWRYEKSIRRLESRVHSVPGATGALYAVRRELYRPLPPGLILDDVLIPMRAVLAGRRSVFEPRARVFDRVGEPAAEYRRKVRTLAGNLQLLRLAPELLRPAANPILVQFVSHKLGRLLVPWFLLALLASSAALAGPLHRAAFGAQVLFYLFAAVGAAAGERGRRGSAGRALRIPYEFVLMNWAAVRALECFARGAGLDELWPARAAGDAPPAGTGSPAAPAPRAVDSLEIELRTDDAALDELAPAWIGLTERTEPVEPFSTHVWVRTWWESFGRPGALRLLVVRDGREEPLGIVPLVADRMSGRGTGLGLRRLTAPWNPHTPRVDWLFAERPEACCRAIWNLLERDDSGWDVLELPQLPVDSPVLETFARLAEESGCLVEQREGSDSPFVPTDGEWERFLRQRSRKFRQRLRRSRRLAAEHGEIELERLDGSDRLDALLDEGFALEAAAWKERAGSAIRCDPEVESFYRLLASRCAERGWLGLYFLRIGGRRAAFEYTVRFGGAVYLLKGGYDPDYSRCSPSMILTSLILQDCHREGWHTCDLLGETERWKLAWTRSVRRHRWLYVYRPSVRARLHHLLKFRLAPRLRGRGRGSIGAPLLPEAACR